MAAVCRAAAARGVAVGAHVSYLDREHFGRRFVDVPADVLRAQVAQQIGTLQAIALARGDARGLREAARGALQHGRPPRGARAGGRRRDHGPARAGAAGVGRAGRGERARAACGHGGVRRPRLPGRRDAGAALGAGGARHGRRTRWRPGWCGWRRTGWSVPSTAPTSRWRAESVCVHSDTPGAPRRWPRAVRAARSSRTAWRSLALRRLTAAPGGPDGRPARS